MGSVIRDSMGAFVAARCPCVLGRFSARDAEALVLERPLVGLSNYNYPILLLRWIA